MKKFILPIIVLLTVLVFFHSKADAQSLGGQDCTYENYYKESYKCLGVFNECQKACLEKAKGSYLDEVTPADKYSACMKSSNCDGKTQACEDQAWADYQACKNTSKSSQNSLKESEAQKETPKQNQNSQDSSKFKLPVFVGEWFRTLSDWISLGEFAIGMKEVANNLTITDDAIIADEEEEKEWDQYYKSYSSLKSQGYTHEQIEATLQKPRKKDVSLSLQELDALKAKFPAGENITNIPGATNTKLYFWETDSGALIKSTDWEKIEFKQPVVKDSVTIRTVKLEEGEIEVKVKNNKPAENQFGVDAGWLGVTVSRTHFWVSQSRDKRTAVVGVYEGEVEVKTKDGKTVKVKPDGNPSTGSGQGKPGVVVVSQKLSPVKLGIAGLVLAAVIGGVFLLLKKKFTSKTIVKKKK